MASYSNGPVGLDLHKETQVRCLSVNILTPSTSQGLTSHQIVIMFFSINFFTLFMVAAELASFALGAPLNDLLSFVLGELANDTKILEARAPTHFNHPGVLLGHTQLEFIKSNVKARKEPWSKSFTSLRNSEFAQLNKKVSARANVDCGFMINPPTDASIRGTTLSRPMRRRYSGM